MIESMTGYGSGKANLAGNSVDVWLRSVNNRSFKLTVRLPEILVKAQQELEELIKSSIARGTVYCQVEVGGPLAGACTIEEKTFLDYCRRLRSLARKAGLSDDIRIEHVASLPGALKESKTSGGALRDLLLKAGDKALRALVKSRRSEGEKIEKELRVLLGNIVALCDRVGRDRKKSLKDHMKRLAERMKDLLVEERDARGIGDIDVIGPAPAYIHRRRGRFRWQLVLRGSELSAFLSPIPFPQAWMIDIDPVSLIG